MRYVAFSTIATTALISMMSLTLSITGCSNDAQPQMRRLSPRTPAEFLGPIPEDFQNKQSAFEFKASAELHAVRWSQALASLNLAKVQGVALTGEGGVDKLPDLNRCGNLVSAVGGAFRPGDIERAPESFTLTNNSGGLSCPDALLALGSSLLEAALAPLHQANSLAQPALTHDACTATIERDEPSARAAIGIEFVRLLGDDKLYLQRFNLPEFNAHFEGGSDGERLALRAETEWTAQHDEAAAATRARQWSGSASFAQGNTLTIHKGDRLDVLRREGDVLVDDKSLLRRSTMILSLDGEPSLTETTTITRYIGDVESEWTFSIKATKKADGATALTVDRDGVSLALTLTNDVNGCRITP